MNGALFGDDVKFSFQFLQYRAYAHIQIIFDACAAGVAVGDGGQHTEVGALFGTKVFHQAVQAFFDQG